MPDILQSKFSRSQNKSQHSHSFSVKCTLTPTLPCDFWQKYKHAFFAVWHDMSYSGNMLINYGNGSVHKSIIKCKPQPLDNDFFDWNDWPTDHSLYCNIQWCSTTNIRRCSTTNSGHLRLTAGKDLWDFGVATLHNTYNTNPKQDPFLAFQM